MLNVEKSDNEQRKRDRMFAEMEICLDLQSEIDHGLISDCSLGAISISDVLNSSESEPEWSKNIEYF